MAILASALPGLPLRSRDSDAKRRPPSGLGDSSRARPSVAHSWAKSPPGPLGADVARFRPTRLLASPRRGCIVGGPRLKACNGSSGPRSSTASPRRRPDRQPGAHLDPGGAGLRGGGGDPRASATRWDYEVESPLRDARGFDLPGRGPAAVVDADEVGAANVILTNGARLYVDHAHPEYSAPEVTNALRRRDLGQGRRAGHGGRGQQAATVPGQPRLQLYKNNVDGKGASLRHPRELPDVPQTPFTVDHRRADAVLRLAPGGHAAPAGSASAPPATSAGFQLSQRADYIEVEVGLETTLKRGIINTRDEPHADADKYRRLHVIIGDANLAEYSTYLKVGTTALVLDMIESGMRFDDLRAGRPGARGARRSATTRP